MCPNCQAYNQKGVSFCINCGQMFPSEKKQVTQDAEPPVPRDVKPTPKKSTPSQSPFPIGGMTSFKLEHAAPSIEMHTLRQSNAPSHKPDVSFANSPKTEPAVKRVQIQTTAPPDLTMRPEFAPLPGSGFEAALDNASDTTRTLYLVIMTYVAGLPYKISFSPRSHHTTFELINREGDAAVFGSVRQPTKTYVAINLKPGQKGFAYGKNDADLVPKEVSPDNLFRNVKGVGHWGAGNLEIRLNPQHVSDGMLPQKVRDAIDDAARVAYGI